MGLPALKSSAPGFFWAKQLLRGESCISNWPKGVLQRHKVLLVFQISKHQQQRRKACQLTTRGSCCYPCKGKEWPVSSTCCLSSDLAEQEHQCSTLELQPSPGWLISQGASSIFSSKTGNNEQGLDGVQHSIARLATGLFNSGWCNTYFQSMCLFTIWVILWSLFSQVIGRLLCYMVNWC